MLIYVITTCQVGDGVFYHKLFVNGCLDSLILVSMVTYLLCYLFLFMNLVRFVNFLWGGGIFSVTRDGKHFKMNVMKFKVISHIL